MRKMKTDRRVEVHVGYIASFYPGEHEGLYVDDPKPGMVAREIYPAIPRTPEAGILIRPGGMEYLSVSIVRAE